MDQHSAEAIEARPVAVRTCADHEGREVESGREAYMRADLDGPASRIEGEALEVDRQHPRRDGDSEALLRPCELTAGFAPAMGSMGDGRMQKDAGGTDG